MKKERNRRFTHTDYRNAKVIQLVEKDAGERFIYKKQDISQGEADRIVESYFEEREKDARRRNTDNEDISIAKSLRD